MPRAMKSRQAPTRFRYQLRKTQEMRCFHFLFVILEDFYNHFISKQF